jgi:NAD+-dependent protein deacetylase sirtuin 4
MTNPPPSPVKRLFWTAPGLMMSVLSIRKAFSLVQYRSLVSLHGHSNLSFARRKIRRQTSSERMEAEGTTGSSDVKEHPLLFSNHRLSDRTHAMLQSPERPPNPQTILSTPEDLQEQVDKLYQWWLDKKRVICLTGAGISTESGIPDYRGHTGSYHNGHKPMIHDHFMKSAMARQRYWGRGMVGWRFFDKTKPAVGHYAVTKLEALGKLGVTFDDRQEYHADASENELGSGKQKLSVITQNVDNLHRRAETKHILDLHGRNDQVTCMHCANSMSRSSFHEELEELNLEWLTKASSATRLSDMRADGDAAVEMSYSEIKIPPCRRCGDGFFKPDVVFFGDSVPSHRVKLCQGAVENCDGLLVVGSSLAVHSAFRHVKTAYKQGIPIAILNVGETRAEIEELNVLKIEAPAGPTLDGLVSLFLNDERLTQHGDN